MNKPSVYLETSFISYLTAKPSRDLIMAGHQVLTAEWWDNHRHKFDLFISPIVFEEVARGDPQAATKRIAILAEMASVDISADAYRLADRLVNTTAIPKEAFSDALHVAIAGVNGINYLLTWNCKHLAHETWRHRKSLYRLQLCFSNYLYPRRITRR
jgi:predicted nucleic acid-binding protein